MMTETPIDGGATNAGIEEMITTGTIILVAGAIVMVLQYLHLLLSFTNQYIQIGVDIQKVHEEIIHAITTTIVVTVMEEIIGTRILAGTGT
jgi:hypothetical protein